MNHSFNISLIYKKMNHESNDNNTTISNPKMNETTYLDNSNNQYNIDFNRKVIQLIII